MVRRKGPRTPEARRRCRLARVTTGYWSREGYATRRAWRAVRQALGELGRLIVEQGEHPRDAERQFLEAADAVAASLRSYCEALHELAQLTNRAADHARTRGGQHPVPACKSTVVSATMRDFTSARAGRKYGAQAMLHTRP